VFYRRLGESTSPILSITISVVLDKKSLHFRSDSRCLMHFCLLTLASRETLGRYRLHMPLMLLLCLYKNPFSSLTLCLGSCIKIKIMHQDAREEVGPLTVKSSLGHKSLVHYYTHPSGSIKSVSLQKYEILRSRKRNSKTTMLWRLTLCSAPQSQKSSAETCGI
jgi:hypothetical protein